MVREVEEQRIEGVEVDILGIPPNRRDSAGFSLAVMKLPFTQGEGSPPGARTSVDSATPLRTWWRFGFPARVQYFSPPSFVDTSGSRPVSGSKRGRCSNGCSNPTAIQAGPTRTPPNVFVPLTWDDADEHEPRRTPPDGLRVHDAQEVGGSSPSRPTQKSWSGHVRTSPWRPHRSPGRVQAARC